MASDISLYLPSGATASAAALRAEEVGGSDEFADAVLSGLGRRSRSIPCRFFYDAKGSELFEEITTLDEYYPTRTETALLEAHGLSLIHI